VLRVAPVTLLDLTPKPCVVFAAVTFVCLMGLLLKSFISLAIPVICDRINPVETLWLACYNSLEKQAWISGEVFLGICWQALWRHLEHISRDL